MRRVVVVRGAESLGVVRVSEVSPESSFRELDDVFLQTQTRIWLGEILHMRFDEETPIADLLADGELLFQVSKVVWKMFLNKRADLKDSALFIHERTSFSKSDGKYLAYPKVDSFLKICQILGLTGIDLFSPSDVVDKRDIRRVCMCIRSLSKKARSNKLNVPDFDIVTYTIAMPNDIVGGIRRTLEQSPCSSSISDSYSDFSRSYKQNDYGGQLDQSHDYFSEFDGAESCFNELEFETPANDSFRGATIFDFDPENFTQRCMDEDSLPELHPDLEQKDQRQCKQHRKSTSLESIGSTCRSITETNKSDIVNSAIDCCESFFFSDAKSSCETEAQIGEKENQSHNNSAPENYLSVSSSLVSLVSAVADDEIIETFVDSSDDVSSTDDKHDNMAFESWIQHEEHGDDSPMSIVQSHNGMSICENSVLGEVGGNISLIFSDKVEGVHENSVDNYSKTTTVSSVDGYASPDYSTKDKQFYLDCSCLNSDDADSGILDSEVQGSVVSLPTREEYSQGQGSSCPGMKAVDQVIYLDRERFSIPYTELFPDNTAAIPSDDKFQPTDDIFSAPAICSYETDADLSSMLDDSSDEHIKRVIQKERGIKCGFVGSALETSELPSDSVDASQTTVSKGQDSITFDGSYPKDKSSCGHLEAEKGLLIGMTMSEKMDIFSHVLARHANQLIYDEDDILYSVLAVNSEENGKIACRLIHKTDSNLNDASIKLKSENLDTESNQYEMVMEMAEQDNIAYRDPSVATRDYLVKAGLKISDVMSREKTSECIIECGNTLESFIEGSSESTELVINDVHSMTLPNADDSCRSTCSEESSEQVLPMEEQNTEHSHSLHTQPETSQGMMNNIQGSGYVSNHDPCERIKHCGLGSHGAELTKNPKVHCYDHTGAPQEFNDDCTRTNSISPCSNSGILEGKNDISTEEISEVQYQVHLVNEVGTITNHTAPEDTPDDTEERQKGTEELVKNAPTTLATSRKSKERNTRRKMVISIAGSITLIGAVFVFLHTRGKKDKEKNSQTVAPQPAKKTSEKVHTQNKVDKSGKSDRMYPGERFKF